MNKNANTLPNKTRGDNGLQYTPMLPMSS